MRKKANRSMAVGVNNEIEQGKYAGAFKILSILILSLTIISCSGKNQKQTESDTLITSSDTTPKFDARKMDATTESAGFISDTMIIHQKAAVFYQPDSLQMLRRMNEVGEADFRAGADDYIYYVNISVEYLEKEGLPVFDAKGRKYLKFISEGNKVHMIKLDTLKELWGMYLFKPGKKAYAADITMIEEEFESYYK